MTRPTWLPPHVGIAPGGGLYQIPEEGRHFVDDDGSAELDVWQLLCLDKFADPAAVLSVPHFRAGLERQRDTYRKYWDAAFNRRGPQVLA